MQQLTPQEFDHLAARTRMFGVSLIAAKRVLTEGMIPAEAARQYDLTRAAVSQAIKRIRKAQEAELPTCPCCGQAIHPKEQHHAK